VITDMSRVYRDVLGPTTVACVRQAVEEIMASNPVCVPKTLFELMTLWNRLSGGMIGLLCFVLAVVISPFKLHDRRHYPL
jgi:hypothetical protein